VKRYGQIAFRVAWLVTRDRGEADDAAQEAFEKAYYALPRFRPDSPFRPWLLRIVANEARNRVRSTRRRQGLALRTAAVSDGDAVPSPETAALAREDQEVLISALNRVSPPDREVIGYRYLLSLSESETAEVLGVRLGTVKSRLSRAMARLRVVLEDVG
jgi:RNA polymerase sigma factor (sigma-70 family)